MFMGANVDMPWWFDVLDHAVPCGPIAGVIVDRPIPFCVAYIAGVISDAVSARNQRLATSLNLGRTPDSVKAQFDAGNNLVITAVLPAG